MLRRFSAKWIAATVSVQRFNNPTNGTPGRAYHSFHPRGTSFLHIGDVRVPIPDTTPFPELVPNVLCDSCQTFFPMTLETKAALRWMAQKEQLGQDMCIVGEPGPLRRWLAQTYCHYAKREMQLLFLSRDTTDSDIKQRKEIMNGNLFYAHQSAVKAALHGQVLIIEGLERAERNVLPIINNLLENREMHLDDGRSIIHPVRYDELLRAQHGKRDNLDHLGLLRCSENFRVIALTVPVPKHPGNPLDPPLRSRLQCFYLHRQADSVDGVLANEGAVGQTLSSLRHSLQAADEGASDADRQLKIPALGPFEALTLLNMHKRFPKECLNSLLPQLYPWELLCQFGNRSLSEDRKKRVLGVLRKMKLLSPYHTQSGGGLPPLHDVHQSVMTSLKASTNSACVAEVGFSTGENVSVAVGSAARAVSGAKAHFMSSCIPAHGSAEQPLHLSDDLPASCHVVMTDQLTTSLNDMVLAHACGRHMLLIGDAGCGKTSLIHRFADVFGYATEMMHLFADMSTRDLLQRRITCASTGDTRWELSPLMQAVKLGHLAILDGIDNLPNGMLAVLQELLIDGSITLLDGTVFKSFASYEALKNNEHLSDEELARRGVFCVHPSFRVIATAKPVDETSGKGGSNQKSSSPSSLWLTADITAMFNTIQLRMLVPEQAVSVVAMLAKRNGINESNAVSCAQKLTSLQQALRKLSITDPKVPQLSLRHIIHVALFSAQHPDQFMASVEHSLMLPLAAPVIRTQLRDLMSKLSVSDTSSFKKTTTAAAQVAGWIRDRLPSQKQGNDSSTSVLATPSSPLAPGVHFISEGTTTSAVEVRQDQTMATLCQVSREYTSSEQSLVPHVQNFVPNVQQDVVLKWLALNVNGISAKTLLVGTQGVGKNKVIDYFLMKMGLPRHYVQLHRDTTVGSLTTTPTVIQGKVIWEDSPLVKAVKLGHVLVVDEIDKAPVEVVQVLKGLVEDREMFLADGRRILSPVAAIARRKNNQASTQQHASIIEMHPEFRIIVLANPPGFPFHGNDFYRVCGDLFYTYVIQNPDAASQLQLLTTLAPNVPKPVLQQLIQVFMQLGKLCEEGALAYPFSLRELIAVVKHLRSYPQDGIYQALNNVFNFDLMDENTMNHIRRILHETLRADTVVRSLRHRISSAIPLDVTRGVLAGSGWFDSSSSTVQLPSSTADILSAVRAETVRLPSEFVALKQYSQQAWQEVVPTEYSELKTTLQLPFLNASSGAKVLSMCTTSSNLIFVMYTDTELTDRRCVGVACLSTPSRGGEERTTGRTLPHRSAILCSIPLNVMSSTATIDNLSMYAMDPMMGLLQPSSETSLRGVFDEDTFSSCVALLDTKSSRLVYVDPLRLARSSLLGVELETCPVDEGEETASVVTPDQQQALLKDAGETKADVDQGLKLVAVSLFGSESRQANPQATVFDQTFDVVSVSPVSSNVASIVPDATTHGTHVLSVTFPAKIESFYFFSEHQAHVILLSSDAAGGMERRHALVKIPTVRSFLTGACTMRYLSAAAVETLGLDKATTFVGVPATSTASSGDSALVSTQIESVDLAGAVLAGTHGPKSGSRGYFSVDASGSVSAYQLPPTHAVKATPSTATTFDYRSGQFFRGGYVFDASTSTARSLPSSLDASLNHTISDFGANYSMTALNREDYSLSTVDRNYAQLEKTFESWKALMEGRGGALGAPPTPKELDMWYSKPNKAPSGSLKHGKEDPENTPHVGGNTWAGGTGGTDTAGLGGLVGPYRLDKGHTVHQVSPEEKKKVPQHIIDEARRMGQQALKERLAEIGMSQEENKMYNQVLQGVSGPIAQLQMILNGLKAQEGERMWARHQSDGVWDDAKIVEGVTGERNIYKRRMESQDNDALRHKKKKRLLFVMDVSASMYRFNGMDQRLNRLVECAVMVMESFIGQEDKIDYAMIGHNGDSDELPLVSFGQPPKNRKERIDVCLKMVAYAQFCWSGDNTVSSMRRSIQLVTEEAADSYFVFVVSDANLRQYGISPSELAAIIRADERVYMYCIFIASFGQQSSQLQSRLPAGHGFECFDTRQLPLVMSQIFTSTNLLS